MFYNICDFIQNKYFDELSDLSPARRQAMLFAYAAEEMPLFLKEDDLFAGWHGFETAPEIGGTRTFPETPDPAKELRDTLKQNAHIHVAFTPGHTCIDYGTILEKGLVHYIDRVKAARKEHPEDEYLAAMDIALGAVCRYAERFAEVAKARAEDAEDERRVRFERIYAALCRVPRHSARSFLEAVQSLWILHTLIPLAEQYWASISVGRLDQYLFPFYQKHLREGGTEEEMAAILRQLFELLDSYADGSCAMNIGGADSEGKCAINGLSRLLIRVEKQMRRRAPIFVLRVTPDTPDEILDELIDPALFQIGQPTFYGELPCRKTVAQRGVSEREAADFSVNSCMGLMLAGREFADMWGIIFRAYHPLELALGSKPPFGGLKPAPAVTDFEQLLSLYGTYFDQLMQMSAAAYEGTALHEEANRPDPLLSALTEGCIEARRDRACGARFNTVTVETMGLINTCDALMAIKTLVFDQKKYTVGELLSAGAADFEGYEALRRELVLCKKYGENDPESNALCKRVCAMVRQACRRASHGNRLYLPSLHTLDSNAHHGSKLHATLDGRKAGQPLNKNANPSTLLQHTQHTDVAQSAAALDQTQLGGGQPIDLYFDKAWFESKDTRDKIKSLVRTYFELGGLQIQVNSVDVDLLEKAHARPEEHPFVIVRKGGYSVYFTKMSPEARADLIAAAKRTK